MIDKNCLEEEKGKAYDTYIEACKEFGDDSNEAYEAFLDYKYLEDELEYLRKDEENNKLRN